MMVRFQMKIFISILRSTVIMIHARNVMCFNKAGDITARNVQTKTTRSPVRNESDVETDIFVCNSFLPRSGEKGSHVYLSSDSGVALIQLSAKIVMITSHLTLELHLFN